MVAEFIAYRNHQDTLQMMVEMLDAAQEQQVLGSNIVRELKKGVTPFLGDDGVRAIRMDHAVKVVECLKQAIEYCFALPGDFAEQDKLWNEPPDYENKLLALRSEVYTDLEQIRPMLVQEIRGR